MTTSLHITPLQTSLGQIITSQRPLAHACERQGAVGPVRLSVLCLSRKAVRGPWRPPAPALMKTLWLQRAANVTSLNEKECSRSITCQTRQRLLSDCETPSEVGQWWGSEIGSLIAVEGYAPTHYHIFALVQDWPLGWRMHSLTHFLSPPLHSKYNPHVAGCNSNMHQNDT